MTTECCTSAPVVVGSNDPGSYTGGHTAMATTIQQPQLLNKDGPDSADATNTGSISSSSSSSSASKAPSGQSPAMGATNASAEGTTANGSASDKKQSKPTKGLIKKVIDPKQDFIKSHNKRVKFSETMQVFCYELPNDQMPQIIALKSPADLNLMEFSSYMFEPPAEYQDYLTFEPPPDYRDFIANSLNVFRNEVTFDFIEDDDDEDSESMNSYKLDSNSFDGKKNGSNSNAVNDQKWKSMILDNNLDSLEEEQIIGVLKEDEILQAIGSHMSLPTSECNLNGDDQKQPATYTFEVVNAVHGGYDDNLSSADFPVHHSYILNSSRHPGTDDDDEDAYCIDSSPNGSLHDLASDSSITSQDTIILINQSKSFANMDTALSQHHSQSSPGDATSAGSVSSEIIYENLQQTPTSLSNNNNVPSDGKGCQSDSASAGSSGGDTSGFHSDQSSDTCNSVVNEHHGPPSADNGDGNVLYENTSELLKTAAANNRLSISSSNSDTSKTDSLDGSKNSLPSKLEDQKTQQQQQQQNKIRQHLMFYENILHHSSSPNVNKVAVNGKTPPGTSVPQAGPPPPPVHLPMYTIIDSGTSVPQHHHQRASSSSSSLSSCSSSSSMTTPAPVTHIFSITANMSVPTSVGQPQLSPNSSSSSSGSASNQNHQPTYSNDHVPRYTLQANNNHDKQPSPTNMSTNAVKQQSHPSPNSGGPTLASMNITSPPPPSHQTVMNAGLSNNVHHPAVVNPNQPQPNRAPGQVIYRYPYTAFIQQSNGNGVRTLRPVQYFVQTNPNTGAQSIICNHSRFVINPQQQQHSMNQANKVMNPSGQPLPQMPTQQPQSQQQQQPSQMNGSAMDSSGGQVPLRQILVPQNAILGSRVMQQQQSQQNAQSVVHNKPPPPYQYYVQQKQQQNPQQHPQQAQLFAYPQNVQVRLANPNLPNEQIFGCHTDFPNASEIRRRDGLYAYPQVIINNAGADSTPGHAGQDKHSSQSAKAGEDRDELEEFVQKDLKRTDRIKKRYSFTEDEDPTFGFARRPSVRGIRPKFGTANEIIKQIASSTGAKSAVTSGPVSQQPHKIIMAKSSTGAQVNCAVPVNYAYGSLPKGAQIIQLNKSNGPNKQQSQPQMISIVKQMNHMQMNSNDPSGRHINSIPVQLKSQTLPRQIKIVNEHGEPQPFTPEIVRILDANQLMNGTTAVATTLTRDQLKLHLQQIQQQQQQHQQQNLHINTTNTSSSVEGVSGNNVKVSPNHPADGFNKINNLVNNNNNLDPGAAVGGGKTGDVFYSMNV